MRGQIKRFVLRALGRMGGVPMPEAALVDSVQVVVANVTRGDVTSVIGELEADGWIHGHFDEVGGATTWTLTEKGEHKAAQLR